LLGLTRDAIVFTEPPFKCENEGWGAFEMSLDLYTTAKGKITVVHDLNFLEERYDKIYPIEFKNPSQAILSRLSEMGALPNDASGRLKKKGPGGIGGDSAQSLKSKQDYEKLATLLGTLNESEVVQVIQMINDHWTEDSAMYIKNDLDGESVRDVLPVQFALMEIPISYRQVRAF